MAGLINSAMTPTAPMAQPSAASAPTQGVPPIRDPILQKIKTDAETHIDPKYKQTYLGIEVAGCNIMFNEKMSKLVLQKLKSNPDISATVSAGVANVIGMVFNHVTEKMAPPQKKQFAESFVPSVGTAAIALMCQVLDLAEQTIGIKITPDIAATCSQATGAAALAKFGINDAKIHQVVTAGQQGQGAQ